MVSNRLLLSVFLLFLEPENYINNQISCNSFVVVVITE